MKNGNMLYKLFWRFVVDKAEIFGKNYSKHISLKTLNFISFFMEKLSVFLLILAIILGILLAGMMVIDASSPVNPDTYSHTKAICNSENFCQDYEIFCKNEEVIKMFPMTGAAIQFPLNWEDPRPEETRNKLC